MSEENLPEPDRIEGAPHPRHTDRLHGQAEAEATFLEAATSGRMHHAWMLTGPRGVGKATLAWRAARFLLAGSGEGGLFGAPTTLEIDPEDPVSRRVAALSEPRLALLRRPWNDKTKKLRAEITVEEVRRLRSLFEMSAAGGGWRVAIVDALDEMNMNAANALLKLLEEPPAQSVFLLVCHRPGSVLPTIRSRCRELRLKPLGPDDLGPALAQAGFDAGGDARALAELTAGSVGDAVEMIAAEGPALYARLLGLVGTSPGLDRREALAIGDSLSGRGAEERNRLAHRLIGKLLHRLARTGALGQPPAEAVAGEAGILTRLAPDPGAGRAWADLSATLSPRVAHALGVNLDPAQVFLDTCLQIDATARKTTS
ncbi:MAG: DNA polymerase III subunit delta' [Rubricella sp.]